MGVLGVLGVLRATNFTQNMGGKFWSLFTAIFDTRLDPLLKSEKRAEIYCDFPLLILLKIFTTFLTIGRVVKFDPRIFVIYSS